LAYYFTPFSSPQQYQVKSSVSKLHENELAFFEKSELRRHICSAPKILVSPFVLRNFGHLGNTVQQTMWCSAYLRLREVKQQFLWKYKIFCGANNSSSSANIRSPVEQATAVPLQI
jgi:hypothetical protein